MFGKHWIAARGTVIERRAKSSSGDGMVTNYDYVVDVRTVEGELFRAKVGEPRIATNFISPSIGWDVAVEYEQKSRDVRFDKSDPQLSMKSYDQSRDDQFDAALAQAPGTSAQGARPSAWPAAVPAQLPNGMPLDPAQLEQLMAAARAAAAGQQTNPVQIMAANAVTIDPNSPQGIALRAALAQFLPPEATPPTVPPQSPAPR